MPNPTCTRSEYDHRRLRLWQARRDAVLLCSSTNPSYHPQTARDASAYFRAQFAQFDADFRPTDRVEAERNRRHVDLARALAIAVARKAKADRDARELAALRATDRFQRASRLERALAEQAVEFCGRSAAQALGGA